MARKTLKANSHDFTRQIHSSKRKNTRFADMPNHDEREARANKQVCCHDCRSYMMGCSEFIGKYHKVCGEFEWW